MLDKCENRTLRIHANLFTTVIIGTEESGFCGEVAVVGGSTVLPSSFLAGINRSMILTTEQDRAEAFS